jgi:hypothetical protein
MKKNLKTFWKNNKELMLILVGVAIVYLILSLFEIPTCPSKVFLGIPCPGCGLSRAFMSVLRLDFAAAFEFHPAWPLVAAAIIAISVLWVLGKTRAYGIVGIFAIVILIGIYIYRVVFTEDAVVDWNFESGLIYRGYIWLTSLIKQ